MLWTVEKRSDRFVVVRDGGGQIVGTHLDKDGANAHLTALYVNVLEMFEKTMSRSEAGKYAAEQRWKNHVRATDAKQETLLTPTDDAEVARLTGRPLKWALPATRDPELTKILDHLVKHFGNRIGYGFWHKILDDPETQKLLDYLDKKGIVGRSTWDGGVSYAAIMGLGLILNAGMAEKLENLSPVVVSEVDFHERATQMVENGSVCVNMTPDAFGKMVSGGRYKTQFETYTSGGYMDPATRATFEAGGLGLHPDMDPTKRPVYGSMQSADWVGTGYTPSRYGSVLLQLKENMRDHTTVSFNDSLGMPVHLPPANSKGKDLARMFNSRQKFYPLEYVEAQIHGGVSVDDIKAVWVDDYANPNDFDLIRGVLDANGYSHIPVFRMFDDEFEKAMTRSEAGKYAAEQRWKGHVATEQYDAIEESDDRWEPAEYDGSLVGLIPNKNITPETFDIETLKSKKIEGLTIHKIRMDAGGKVMEVIGVYVSPKNGKTYGISSDSDSGDAFAYAKGNKAEVAGLQVMVDRRDVGVHEIFEAMVINAHLRVGLMTAMLETVRATIGGVIHHSDILSEQGAAWADATPFDKATFMSRSEAGRYAAEQRWKNHAKQVQPAVTEAGKEFQRIWMTPSFNSETGVGASGQYKYEYKEWTHEVGGALDPVANRALVDQFMLEHPEYVVYEKTPGRFYTDYVDHDVKKISDTIVNPDEPHSDLDLGLGERSLPMLVDTSPPNPKSLKIGGLLRFERGSVKKEFTAEDPWSASLGWYASEYQGFDEPYPKPDNSWRVYYQTSEAKLAGIAANLVQSMREASPSQPVLWRGVGGRVSVEVRTKLDNVKEGDTFDLGLASFSRDATMAADYARNGVMIRIRQGSRGLKMPAGQSLYAHDQEVVSSGRFKVMSVEKVKVINQRQVDFNSWKRKEITKMFNSGTMTSKVRDTLLSQVVDDEPSEFTIVDVVQEWV